MAVHVPAGRRLKPRRGPAASLLLGLLLLHTQLEVDARASALRRSLGSSHRHQSTPPTTPQLPVAKQPLQHTPLLRLRGGGPDDMIGAVQRAYLSVPVVARSWLTLVIALAVGSQAGVLPDEALSIDGGLIVGKKQLWRPLTAASFCGGVSGQLLQKLYYLVSFGKTLEGILGTGEFLRALASAVAMMTFVCHVLGWPFSADGIIMVVTVLCTLQNPTQQVSMYGLNIPYQFFPLAQLALSYVFTQQVPYVDIAGLFVGYALYRINDNLKPDEAVADKLSAAKPGAPSRPGGRSIGGGGSARGGGGGGGGGGSRSGTSRSGRKPRIVKVTSSCSSGG